MNIIVAVDKSWGIGYNGQLLISIPEDMQRFREKTVKKIVVMGRTTYESLNKPLRDRVNIVITSNPDYNPKFESVEVCTSIKSVFELLTEKYFPAGYNTNDVFIIGGGRVYEDFLPYCEKAYVTMIDEQFENVDVYFPNLMKDTNWKYYDGSLLNVSKKDGTQFIYLDFKNQNVIASEIIKAP